VCAKWEGTSEPASPHPLRINEVKLPNLPPTYNGPDKPQLRRVFCPKCQMYIEYDVSLFASNRAVAPVDWTGFSVF
jgi:hypothetical protein